jgi:hypothetical protein
LACALYGYNPLAWWLNASLRRDAETAADHAVLEAGVRSSDYAEHLVEIAGRLRAIAISGSASPVAVAMARRSDVAGRVRAILAGSDRRPLTRRQAACILLAVGLALLPVAVLQKAAPRHDDSRAATSPGHALPDELYYGITLGQPFQPHGDWEHTFAQTTSRTVHFHVLDPPARCIYSPPRQEGADVTILITDNTPSQTFRVVGNLWDGTKRQAEAEPTTPPRPGVRQTVFRLHGVQLTSLKTITTSCDSTPGLPFIAPFDPLLPDDPARRASLQHHQMRIVRQVLASLSRNATRADVEERLGHDHARGSMYRTMYYVWPGILVTIPYDDYGGEWSPKNRVTDRAQIRVRPGVDPDDLFRRLYQMGTNGPS